MTNRSTSSNREKLLKLTQVGILTAIVVVLQLVGAFIKFGPFSVSLVLVPIVIGAILCGPLTGAWLGLVFGAVVLLSGDAAAFYALSPAGTIFLVLFKGTMAGLCSGLVYKAGRKVLVGNYSGYFYSMPYPAVAFQTRTPEMLASSDVDYQASPFSYYLWHRGTGGTGLLRSPFETYAGP